MTETIDNMLQDTISHLYAHAPGFRQRLDDVGLTPVDLQTEADLPKLPILRKDDLIALQQNTPPFGGMLAVPLSDLARLHQSPGPINEPIPHTTDSGRWAAGLKAAGFQAGEVVLNAFGYHLTPAGASFEDSLNAMGCVVIPGGIGNQEQQIAAMVAFGTTGYVGLPSYLKALLDKAEQLGTPLQLNKAFVLAEPLPPSLRNELKDKGVAVFQGYGTAECGNLGFDTAVLNGWHIPENTLIHICDINSGQPLPHGETGEVVVTLFNKHYALIRFGVGDLSAIVPESAVDGGPLRLKGWLGRVGAATKVRGMFLHPTQLANMMQRFDTISAYQAVITRENHRDYLSLHIVLDDESEAESIVDSLKKSARDALKFKLDGVTIVPTLPPDTPPIRDERTWD
ncbi:MAG: phenylacetate--CoA ligase [Chloroflexi bacterium]|nr:phenylacetate--CoA ligase [Chloroflexota bacterium]